MSERLTCAMLMSLLAVFVHAGEAKKPRPGKIPDNPAKLERGGMEGGAWSLEGWGNPGSAEKVTRGAGRMALKAIYLAGEKEKCSFKHLTNFGADAAGKATLHVYVPDNTAKPPQVALAVSTTLAYIWHESKYMPLKTGWNALEFTLSAPNWKTEKSKWQFDGGIANLGDVRAVNVIFSKPEETGWLIVEGLHFDPDEKGRKVEGLIKQMLAEDFEARAKAEAELIALGRPALEALNQLRNSDDIEVIMRAGNAVRKIESIPEELPNNPELKAQILKQREETLFQESVVRADYLLQTLQSERLRVEKLVKDSEAELARGREEFKKLEFTAEEEKKAYVEKLDQMEKTVKELKLAMQGLPDPKALQAEAEKKQAEMAKMEAEKTAKLDAMKSAEEEQKAAEIKAEREKQAAKEQKPLEIPTLKPPKK